jgi:hypothetical protein
MKKLLLSATLLAITLSSIAQTQIPNGDFETWATFSKCSGIDSLGNFISFDQDLYNDQNPMCNTTQSIIKSTDAYSGDYALKMTGINYLGLGMISNYVNIATDLNTPGIAVPFTSRPTKLTGYYKFTQAGTDTLGISVGGYDANDNELFYGEMTKTASVSTYTKFEINLDYDPLFSTNPIILNLYISIGNTNDESDASTVLYIDNLEFEYTTTATTAFTTTSPVHVYTSQKDIIFSSEVSDVIIYNLVGSQELNQTVATKTVNAAALKSGLYVVTYKYNDNFYSKKVVVE